MAYDEQEYVEEERRSRWLPAAATFCLPMGWADPRRIAASLVVAVLLLISTSSSSFLALLASRPSAGYARLGDGL
jgi:hypothetical protein